MNDQQMEKYYRQAVSQQKAPEDLVQDTIQKMHQERERMIQQASQKHTKALKQRSLILGGIAVAFAASICVLSIGQNDKLKMNEFIYQPDIRLDMVYRADGEGESITGLENSIETKLASEMDGYMRTAYRFYDFAMDEDISAMWVASATYSREKCQPFQIIISNFPTTTHQTLMSGDTSKINDVDVFAGKDSESGDFFAVWQQNDYYVQLQLEDDQNWSEVQRFNLLRQFIDQLH